MKHFAGRLVDEDCRGGTRLSRLNERDAMGARRLLFIPSSLLFVCYVHLVALVGEGGGGESMLEGICPPTVPVGGREGGRQLAKSHRTDTRHQ